MREFGGRRKEERKRQTIETEMARPGPDGSSLAHPAVLSLLGSMMYPHSLPIRPPSLIQLV